MTIPAFEGMKPGDTVVRRSDTRVEVARKLENGDIVSMTVGPDYFLPSYPLRPGLSATDEELRVLLDAYLEARGVGG